MPRIDRQWVDQILILDGGSTDGSKEYLLSIGYDVIDEQVQPHARRHAENRCKPKRDCIRRLKQRCFRISVRSSVKRDWLKRNLLRAEDIEALGAVAAIGCGVIGKLVFSAEPIEQCYYLKVHGARNKRVTVTGGHTNNACQPN